MSHIDDLRASSCTGKKPFPSRKKAKQFYRNFNKPKKDPLVAYKCDFCPAYHLGHLQPGSLLRVASFNNYYHPE